MIQNILAQNADSLGNDAPTVISTFAGAGGSSLGYKMAGYKELLAVENEKNAIKTFKLNFLNIPIFADDIARLSVRKCLRLAKLKPKELDILDGSPPCQGFSIAGKRDYNDNRNQLFNEFCRLLQGLQPKIFVMENVTGLYHGHMKQVLKEILKELRGSGYKVRVEILNAMYFQVPQKRRRLIFIGIRTDLDIEPSHPRPKYKPITFQEAIKGLQDYCDRAIKHEYLFEYAKSHDNHKWVTNQKLYKQIKGNLAGAINTNWLWWDMVCGTIMKSEIASSGIIHPNRKRYLNLSELKRIGSFPDDFQFTDRKNGNERIGNSVPPMLMYHIAKHIKENILENIK